MQLECGFGCRCARAAATRRERALLVIFRPVADLKFESSCNRRCRHLSACGVRKVGSCGVAVFVEESAEAVASLYIA